MKLKSISLLFVAGGLLVQTACANRLLHPQLKENPSVMRRSWTLGTRSIFGESGDRGYEFSNSVQFENTLIFGSRESGVVSIYPKLKSIRWRFRVEGGVESEIAVEQGLVYFGGGDGFFYAINANTGRLEWKIEIRTQHVSRPTVVNNRVLFTSSDDTIYAHDAKTGKWLWHYKRKSGQMATIRTASTPTVIGNQVLAGLSDGYLVAI
jgi:outer membrane protein assembly factor BamB